MNKTNNIAYLVDSTLAKDMIEMEQRGIFVQPLYVIIDEVAQKDIIEISAKEFYDQLDAGAMGSTSQPSAGDFLATYEQIKEAGFDTIIVFTVAEKLSGTRQSAQTAAGLIKGITIHVVNTNTSSAIGTAVVEDVMNFAKQTPEVEQIVKYANQRVKDIEVFIYVANLEGLKRGGRLSPAKALIGSLMQIKPIMMLKDGEIDIVGKERTLKKAIRKITELVGTKTMEQVIILKTTHEALSEEVIKEFEQRYPKTPYTIQTLSPVIGVHLGSEACAIAVLYKK
ncbi:MAG: DegV family protein [Culicoidibacterales bacterium]